MCNTCQRIFHVVHISDVRWQSDGYRGGGVGDVASLEQFEARNKKDNASALYSQCGQKILYRLANYVDTQVENVVIVPAEYGNA